MRKLVLASGFLGILALGVSQANAHSHHHHDHIYIVETPPPQPHIVVEAATPQYVMVEHEPPADIQDEIIASPGEGYAWRKGYWKWDGNWVRVNGAWVTRPHSGAVLVPGYWEKRHHHYHWVEGRWD